MNAKDKKELKKNIADETKLISGLLKVVDETAVCQGYDGEYTSFGSLVYIREQLVEILVGFYTQPNGSESAAKKRITAEALKKTTSMVRGGILCRKIAGGRWVSIPENED